ncbi:hypothetical protein [Curtobacterium sp. ME26]|uniref:hypothetical protein n=1 Tax=Curtobacterium sp. ME26 TaxID=2744254 RepID=UPI0015F737AB|nr:hypothetical protein [Curtobacterium sp. ME26]
MKKVIAAFASVLMLASVLVAVQLAGPTSSQERADALSGSSFQAGNIISDANFYDGDSMSASQVQSFLNGQVGSCTNSGCLRNGRYSLNSHGADAMCGALTGGSSLSAADIITRVGRACSISPKVILVTLQKEQALVTSRGPSAAVLERAMGYACPDNAQGRCDPAYAGVGNQVYWAAWQWKRYGNPSGTSNYFTWFAPGGTRQIQYNVPTSCGTKGVAVQNKATAALYYYTPYTPNTAALNNLYGTGDGCSAYGNRNFWRMYSDWFGSPTASAKPIGKLDSVVDAGDAVQVRGWALDPTTAAATRVHVFVDSAGAGYTANVGRPDVGKAYPGFGDGHGFDLTIAAAPGKHEVCASAISVDGTRNQSIGCKTVTVTKAAPDGRVDSVRAVVGGVAVRGWTFDPDQPTKALSVKVSIGGKVTQVSADRTRTDVGRAYPSAGSAHGYEATIPAASGSQAVCVTAVNVGNGRDTRLGSCTTVRAVASVPDGRVDAVTPVQGGLSLRGWAIDGDTAAPINVDVYVDGVGRRIAANVARPDIGSAYPAFGAAHGFQTTIAAAPGEHEVCVYAINTGAGSGNPNLGCRTVEAGSSPVGRVDSIAATSGGVAVRGWAYDPDTGNAPIAVHVYVGDRATVLRTGQSRPDVATAYPAAGSAAGYTATVAAPKGTSTVCVYAIDANGATNTTLGCRSVTVQ